MWSISCLNHKARNFGRSRSPKLLTGYVINKIFMLSSGILFINFIFIVHPRHTVKTWGEIIWNLLIPEKWQLERDLIKRPMGKHALKMLSLWMENSRGLCTAVLHHASTIRFQILTGHHHRKHSIGCKFTTSFADWWVNIFWEKKLDFTQMKLL